MNGSQRSRPCPVVPRNREFLLGSSFFCGGVAAYKAADLCSRLVRALGAKVTVIDDGVRASVRSGATNVRSADRVGRCYSTCVRRRMEHFQRLSTSGLAQSSRAGWSWLRRTRSGKHCAAGSRGWPMILSEHNSLLAVTAVRCCWHPANGLPTCGPSRPSSET